ncbi:hypothetical protein CDAR_95401 [Caerostris darwini]|uniref:Uncharacterized protein n=1 Tax=Caerostris darwini TaxID=1538125 RepID=A0AAV4PMT8_9ARAC|nr:hypothetical protein CDAR_95401 [Caerostris darwini]
MKILEFETHADRRSNSAWNGVLKIRNENRARGDDPFIDRAGRFLRILISSPAFPVGELKRRGALTKRSPAKSISHPQRMVNFPRFLIRRRHRMENFPTQ